MAELTAFAYSPGDTLLHRIDIRFKLAAVASLNVVALQSQMESLPLLSLPIFAGFLSVGLPVRRTFREMRYLLLFMGFLFLLRSFSWSGEGATGLLPLSFSAEGAIDGALVCWRLAIVIFSGLLFVRTSRALEVKAAVVWFLKPIPLIPAGRFAVIISLMVRFLPEILRQSAEIAEAQKARGIENRKNPLFRLAAFSVPLCRRIFQNADDLACAMEARCFDETRTDVTLSSKTSDWFFALFTSLFFALLLLL